jgi:hypothetical protein
MRLKAEQVQKLSALILQGLMDKDLAKLKADKSKVLERIRQAITDDLNAEDRLDEEVRQLMDQFRSQIEAGALNERELFLKIKKEMAKKKKMVL